MQKKLLMVISAVIAVFLLGSCTKTNHSVYMTVSGNSSATKVVYGEGATMDAAQNKNSTTIYLSGLPWTSATYTVKGGDVQAFYLYACNNESAGTAPNITIRIYDNGNEVATSTCDTASCICQQVSFVAN
jgi:hypothetical protein